MADGAFQTQGAAITAAASQRQGNPPGRRGVVIAHATALLRTQLRGDGRKSRVAAVAGRRM